MLRSIQKELSPLVKLAAPVSLAQMCLVGMTATDVLIAGRAGTMELAGMNLGGNAWNMVILFFVGIGWATQPLIANRDGANDLPRLIHNLQQCLWLCFFLGCLAMLIVWLMTYLLTFGSFDPDLLSIAVRYLLVISLAAVPMVMFSASRGGLEGMGYTREVFFINFGMFLLNIPLDYVLVNGLYGFPKLGAVGCALASVVLIWLAFITSILTLKRHPKIRSKAIFSIIEGPSLESIRSILKLGLPIGLSVVIELSMFSGAGILIATFGAIEVGAHAVAITLASMSFMLYMGLAQGVTIRASQFLGAGKTRQAWFTVKVGTGFNMFLASLVALGFVVFNEPLVRLFSEDLQVIHLAVVLMYFGAAFQLGDCLQIATMCALRAYGDTTSPPKYQVFAFLILGLPVGAYLAFGNFITQWQGAKGMWFAMLVSLSLVGLLLTWRLIKYKPTADQLS